MAANASPDTSAHPTKDEPTCPERDGRKTAQNDDSDEQDNKVTQTNPPNNKTAAQKGSPAKFLQWLHPDTPLEANTLSEKWDYWHPRDMAEDRQPRDDPRPTWSDGLWGDSQ